MLVAGRCLSSDRDANSALRVQATCMAMGQVAGVAAASCAKYGLNVYDMPISVIKSGLIKIGAIVPENKKRGD
ncbi:MAG: FAD-dependent oxidoreductase, partial [Clostridia bacterium]|nr:FAD-dependent oxidoreductase [Clostridia bacterium]